MRGDMSLNFNEWLNKTHVDVHLKDMISIVGYCTRLSIFIIKAPFSTNMGSAVEHKLHAKI